MSVFGPHFLIEYTITTNLLTYPFSKKSPNARPYSTLTLQLHLRRSMPPLISSKMEKSRGSTAYRPRHTKPWMLKCSYTSTGMSQTSSRGKRITRNDTRANVFQCPSQEIYPTQINGEASCWWMYVIGYEWESFPTTWTPWQQVPIWRYSYTWLSRRPIHVENPVECLQEPRHSIVCGLRWSCIGLQHHQSWSFHQDSWKVWCPPQVYCRSQNYVHKSEIGVENWWENMGNTAKWWSGTRR